MLAGMMTMGMAAAMTIAVATRMEIVAVSRQTWAELVIMPEKHPQCDTCPVARTGVPVDFARHG